MDAPGEFDPGFWLQIIREGDTFRAYYSQETTLWRLIGVVTMSMPQELFVGIAVTSHNVDAAAWGRFEDVRLSRGTFEPAPVPFE